MSKLTIGKFFKSSGMGACLLALLFTGSLFIIASGGGGGGDSAPAESATLSESNADAAADATMQSLDMAGPTAMMGGAAPLGTMGGSVAVESPMRDMFSRAYDGYRTAVAEAKGMSMPLTQYDCDNVGGTMNIPELTEQDIIQASITGSLSMTMSYNNCVQGTQTLDGAMTMRMVGDVVNQIVNSMTITVSYLHMIDTDTNDDITMTGYQMIGDQLTFDAQGDELTAATFTVTGDVAGTVDGQPIDASFHRLAVRFVQEVGGESLRINGMLYNNCIGGWATVSTATPIFMPDLAACPTSGDFSIKSGANTVRVTAASGSITVYFNDANPVIFNPCTNVEGQCTN